MKELPVVQHRVTDWLPTTLKEVKIRGWEELDVILFSGDAYVDHPSFGNAVIGRILEEEGLRVAIVAQPNWQDDLRDFKKLGTPKMFFGVSSGCMDSMVNHYTANRRKRSTDAYTAGGKSGFRPDYAVQKYTKILKSLFPDVPVIIGGIEASLRRVTHFDYWEDRLFPSILYKSGADLLVYGMGELPLRQLIRLMKKGVPLENLDNIPQTAVLKDKNKLIPTNKNWEDLYLHSHNECLSNKKSFAANFKHIEQESNKVHAKRLIQEVFDKMLVINPPFPPMSEQQIDRSFDLPYTRLPHPKYQKRGVIPAYEMIKHSVNMHRGCFGGCSFCTISAHQGKFIASRSESSILREIDKITEMEDFKGYISDLGGPSANMYRMKGIDQSICDRCVAPSCIHPVICSNLDTSHKAMMKIYKKVDAHPKIKKAFVSSGIRYDLLVEKYNKNHDSSLQPYMEQLVARHINGRLKVAPEHTSEITLKHMRKPSFDYFYDFKKSYDKYNSKYNLRQPLIPYFISSHPGCTTEEMANLAAETKDMGFKLEQVQDFTPTPMTLSTVIYYSGFHPYTLKPIYTAKTKKQKLRQHMFFFWYKREKYHEIRNELDKIGRTDIIDILLKSKKKIAKKNIISSRSKWKKIQNRRK